MKHPPMLLLWPRAVLLGLTVTSACSATAADAAEVRRYAIDPGGQYTYFLSPEGPGLPGGMPSAHELDFEITGLVSVEYSETTPKLLDVDLVLLGNEAIQDDPPGFGLVTADRVAAWLESREFEQQPVLGPFDLYTDKTYAGLELTDLLMGTVLLEGGYDHTPADGIGVQFSLSATAIPEPGPLAYGLAATFVVGAWWLKHRHASSAKRVRSIFGREAAAHHRICLFAAAALFGQTNTAVAAPIYSAQVLAQYGTIVSGPRPSVTSTVPVALNDAGWAVTSSAFLEAEGTGVLVRPDGDLLFNDAFGFVGSEATGINSEGAVVGAGIFDFAAQFPQPFVYRPGVGIEFLPKPLDDDISEGRVADINDQGIAVGGVDTVPGGAFDDRGRRAAVWQDDEVTVLGTLGGEFSVATRINNNGLVIGRSPVEVGGFAHSFVWTEANGLELIPDPAGFGGLVAHNLNDAGTIVGWMDRDLFDRFAFIRDATTEQVIPLDRAADEFLNQAHAINGGGIVVGVGQRREEDSGYAKLWLDGVGYDLNDLVDLPEFHLTEAVDVNERGQILVIGFQEVQPGIRQGFSIVLTPIPEPHSAVLVIVAAATLFIQLSRHNSIPLSLRDRLSVRCTP